MAFKNSHYLDSIRNRDNMVSREWYGKLWAGDTGLHEGTKWYEPSYQPVGWSTMQVPGRWQDAGLKNTNGVVWLRREIIIPSSMVNRPAFLRLGNVIDRDSVYLNGIFVGTTGYQYPPRKYWIPAGVLKEGKNVLVVRIINSSGYGGFYPDKPYYLLAGDSIDLKGSWQYRLGYAMPPHPATTTFHYQPFSLFNALIHPLLPYGIKGVLWYQGESNTGNPAEYEALFTTLIRDWREQFNKKELPFLFVQLANFMEAKDQPSQSNWAAVRDAQRKTLSLPYTAMVVTLDAGEWNDVHPLNKKIVGDRLALAADNLVYGRKTEYSGPLYQSAKIKGTAIEIKFTHTGSGLMAKGGPLKGFAIAGKDKQYHWAEARIDGNKIIVWSDAVKEPLFVRYAWADNPQGANLYNREGLPASSFSTEN